MQRTLRVPSRAHQWGKAGPIMALVSILIMAVLAKVTLAQFGFTSPKDGAAKPANAAAAIAKEIDGDDDDSVAATAPSKPAATQTPANSLDKARAVQGLIDGRAAKTVSQIETEGK